MSQANGIDAEGMSLMENFGVSAGREAYVLTDEQILGVEAEEAVGSSDRDDLNDGQGSSNATATTSGFARGEEKSRSKDRPLHKTDAASPLAVEGRGAQSGIAMLQEPPKWLAREMQDPWVGDEARELWEGAQQAQREATAYREVIGSAEDARALKEIYPGGVAEARSAAERARELAEIDAAIFGAPGRGAEETRAGRAQLVERLHAQDSAALREMVETGLRLLERAGQPEKTSTLVSDAAATYGAMGAADRVAQAGVPMPQETLGRYREFERATNADLEKSVGSAIGRAMEAALPNLRRAEAQGDGLSRNGQALPLQDKLQAAVKEEVEAGLRSDAALGEQVARVLSGRRFDEAARAQVVRLIDARAQQLVPGAVKRVVSGWTAATLGSGKKDSHEGPGKSMSAPRTTHRAPDGTRNDRPTAADTGRKLPRGRVDYRKWSDDQILEM